MSFTFQEVSRFPPSTVAIKIAMSLAVGMLVGFERESANKDVGTRTFGLTALLGALSVLISPQYGLAAMIGVIVLIAFLNARSMIGSGSLEITTSAALLVTYALGALVGLGHTFTPVASAILMTLLLAWKVELRKFAGGVSIDELRSAVLLGLIGLVIYPVLPNRFIDRWELVNLRQAWVSVVVIASIAFVNYVLLRLYSTRGLYSTAHLRRLGEQPRRSRRTYGRGQRRQDRSGSPTCDGRHVYSRHRPLALFAPQALLTAVGPLFAMACAALFLRGGKPESEPGQELKLGSPISLRRVLGYGILFLAIQVVGTLAAEAIRELRPYDRKRHQRCGEQCEYYRGSCQLDCEWQNHGRTGGNGCRNRVHDKRIDQCPGGVQASARRSRVKDCQFYYFADTGWHRGARDTAPFSIAVAALRESVCAKQDC